MDFTLQLTVAVSCSACGRLWDLSGPTLLDADADAHESVVAEVEGPCPGCGPDDGPDGGEEADAGVVAAE